MGRVEKAAQPRQVALPPPPIFIVSGRRRSDLNHFFSKKTLLARNTLIIIAWHNASKSVKKSIAGCKISFPKRREPEDPTRVQVKDHRERNPEIFLFF